MEEDGDDDDLLMKELEDLANGDDCAPSEGGNTSVDSQMEDTPSNYNLANGRLQDEQMRQNAREARGRGLIAEDLDLESEYGDLPGRRTKRKPKKKKKKKQ